MTCGAIGQQSPILRQYLATYATEVNGIQLPESGFMDVDTLSTFLDSEGYTVIRKHVSLQGIMVSDEFFMEDTFILLQILSVFGADTPSPFDTNSDQMLDTMELLFYLGALGSEQPYFTPFNCFGISFTFGEGNTWLDALECEETALIDFGWLHRTPYDEPNEPNDTYSLNSFVLDVIWDDSTIEKFTFIQH